MTGLDDAPTAIVNQLTADEYFDGNETELQLQKAIASLPNKFRHTSSNGFDFRYIMNFSK